jgi:hypothetical protein
VKHRPTKSANEGLGEGFQAGLSKTPCFKAAAVSVPNRKPPTLPELSSFQGLPRDVFGSQLISMGLASSLTVNALALPVRRVPPVLFGDSRCGSSFSAVAWAVVAIRFDGR